MKVADYIFRFSTFQHQDNGLCRVRVFVLSNGTVFVLVTDIGQLGTGALVSYNIEWIRQQLSTRALSRLNASLLSTMNLMTLTTLLEEVVLFILFILMRITVLLG